MASRKQQRIDPNKVAKVQVPARLEENVRIPREARATGPAAPASKGRSGRPGGRPPTAPKIRKARASDWIGGARLRTLSLSISPVILGTAAVHTTFEPWQWLRIGLALAVAVFLQVGVNYANDYSDGVRGTDKFRLGPSRLTGSGAARPRTVLTVALTFFALAAIAGVVLVVETTQYWLLVVGAVSIVAAYFYSGGKRPYGYYGLGEVFVFVFFGLVATVGTTYVQLGTVSILAWLNGEAFFYSWLSGAAIGFIACAALMVNNIRDLPQDKLAGKRTFAVLIGNKAARIVFVVFIVLPFVILTYFVLLFPNAYLTYLVLAFVGVPTALITLTAKTPPELVLALKLTSLMALLFAIGLGWAMAF